MTSAGITIPESPYATQLAQGFPGLRFARGLEREFEAEFTEQHLPRMRAGFAAAAAVYLVHLLVRWRIESGSAEEWGLILRSIAIAGALVPLAASYWRRLRAFTPWIVPAGYALFAAGITGVEIVARRYALERHYEALILASFHLYVFGALLLRPALAAGAGIVGVYLIGGAFGGLISKDWVYPLTFIALAHLIGGGALYWSERVERENFLRRKLYGMLATHDGLTGLLNRLAFTGQAERLLKQAAREGHGIGLIMIDIDHFKPFNDHYGHVEGDACLKAVAQAVREEFRRPLDALGRFGGEEFVGLWYDIQPAALRSMAEQVRAAVQARRIEHAQAPSGRVTASIGAVACVPGEEESLTALIQRADRALYEAKERGRNRVVIEVLARATPVIPRRQSPPISGAG